jgi:hypothetical protein
MACDGLLTGDILFDCDNQMVGGIEVDVLIFNHSDIDKVATTFDSTNKSIITNFALKSGKTGFLLEGVKQINSLASSLVIKEMGNDKESHVFSGVVLNFSAQNKQRLHEMKGGDFAVMVQLKWKGASSEDAFQIGGFDVGMRLTEVNFATNENDAVVSFVLSSIDGFEESKPILTVLDTDYATTSTAFTNKFATA